MNSVKNALTRKFGPAPAWVWAIIVGVAVYFYRRSTGGGGGGAAGSSGVDPTTAYYGPYGQNQYPIQGGPAGGFTGGGGGDSGGGAGSGAGGGGTGGGSGGAGGPAPPPTIIINNTPAPTPTPTPPPGGATPSQPTTPGKPGHLTKRRTVKTKTGILKTFSGPKSWGASLTSRAPGKPPKNWVPRGGVTAANVNKVRPKGAQGKSTYHQPRQPSTPAKRPPTKTAPPGRRPPPPRKRGH